MAARARIMSSVRLRVWPETERVEECEAMMGAVEVSRAS